MINNLINHRMTSLQKNAYRTLTIRQMLNHSSIMFPETAHFSGHVVHDSVPATNHARVRDDTAMAGKSTPSIILKVSLYLRP